MFVKELLFYIENTNEIDEKTQKLLIDAVLAINVLHTNGKLHETASIDQNDSDFLDQLDNVQFESRRYIMCCLCHVSENIFCFQPIFAQIFFGFFRNKSH